MNSFYGRVFLSVNPGCNIIAVVGGKGGVGKSVFSANLALTILRELRQQTLLVDLDANSCGDQNVILGMRPPKGVNDLCQSTVAMTEDNLKSFISKHSSGLSFLPAVTSPDQTLDASGDLFKKQLYSISQFYKNIVVDLGNELGDLQLSILDHCTVVLVVTSPEVLVLNQTRKAIGQLARFSIPANMIHVVVNKATRATISPQAIMNSLKKSVIGVIPQDEVSAYGALQRAVPFVLTQPNSALTKSYTEITRKLTGGLLQKLKSISRPKREQKIESGDLPPDMQASRDDGLDAETLLKLQIHSQLIKEMDLKKDLTNTKGDKNKERELRNKTQQVISNLVDRFAKGVSREERAKIIKQVLDESLGLGPLEELLADKKVSEIMVNGAKQIYAERGGKLTLTSVSFTSNVHLKNVIERIVTPLGRRIDEKTPYVDARLADGSRVNAVIEPLAIDGPSLTIRKFPEETITIDHLVSKFGTMTTSMAEFLKICVEQHLNIIISGGTGSGKTTLLNVMSSFIQANERIITVEDAAELQLKQEHVVRLETRPANMEGTGEVTIRDLIKNSLRMRPDRVVVGECRDGAALDMLSAMNTGHDGSMTTVHANNPREAVARLETLCLMSGMDLPVKSIRDQIGGAVNLIIQIGRLSDGSRKVKSITEVVGVQGETVTLQEIFRFKEEGFDKNRKIVGQFQAMGLIPTFIEKFEKRGIKIPRSLFTTSSSATPNLASKPGSNLTKPSKMRRPTAINPKLRVKKKVSGGDS